jgi:hypothetical protein
LYHREHRWIEPQRTQSYTENILELEPFDAVCKLFDIEVEEQSSAHFSQLHIG